MSTPLQSSDLDDSKVVKASKCCGSKSSVAFDMVPASLGAFVPAIEDTPRSTALTPSVGFCCGPKSAAGAGASSASTAAITPTLQAPVQSGFLSSASWAARSALALASDFVRFATPPVIMIGAILLGLLVVNPSQAEASATFALKAFVGILPFFALSIALAAGAKASGADALVGRAFSGREGRSIVVAALAGALSPFCSCGVIPVVTAFLMAGVPLAPVMAFWISSPLMDPNMFVLTAGGLGLEFAIAKTLAAIGMGLFAGYATKLIVPKGSVQALLKVEVASSCGCGPKKVDSAPVLWRFWDEPARAQMFLQSAGKNAWFLGRWLALAFVLESLMVAFIPASLVTAWLGGDGPLAIPLAVGLGIPAYLNGYAAIPLVAGLIKLGMSPAVGLGFMLGGGVTSVPAAMAVWAVATPKLFRLYLVFAAIGSLASAYVYALFLAAR